MSTGARVRDYYDANTWKFLLSSRERTIHRELWGEGVTDRSEAAHHVHRLVLEVLDDVDRHQGPAGGGRRVLDLGCGVGAAGLYLARRRPVEVTGVTISPSQVRLARRYADRAGPLLGSVRFELADFTALPAHVVGFDVAFAIESFVHADPAEAFFRSAAAALRPGGALVVIDDVRSGPGDDDAIAVFRAGWHAASVVTVPEAAELADRAGLDLVESRDLSALQRLGRPRDRLIQVLQPLLRTLQDRSAWARSMVGGDALQHCHRTGLLEYRLLRFARRTG